MFVVNYLLLSIFITCVWSLLTHGFNNEDQMHLVSPDQHTQTPRLEDFFWTGSGDGPPPPDLSEPLPEPSTPVVHTTTVLATVYLDSYPPQAVTDSSGECVHNCDSSPGSLEPDVPEDRRYWLLTVIQGATPDSLQLRLARLYQKAFLRQQERHLGIIKSLDASPPRKKHDVHSFVVNKDSQINPISSDTPLKYSEIESSIVNVGDITPTKTITSTLATFVKVPESSALNGEMYLANSIDTSFIDDIEPTSLADKESWVLVTPTIVLKKREINIGEEFDMMKEDMIDLPLEEDNNGTLLYKREIIKPEQQPPVQVHIQNISESAETGSVQIVYVVLVGGRAVPAAVAARDMRLVRDAEVAKELGAVVTTKAEPAYLKAAEGLEGEAAPAGVHGTELWALIVGSTIALLLLVILFVLLCLAHRKKSLKSAASLRAYRNELMRELEQSKQEREDKNSKQLISVVSPSRTRPSSALLPIYRKDSTSGSSTTSSGVSEVAVALRRRQKKPHALRMPQKKRVGTTDSLLEAAGVESSDSGHTPTSYLSMPSISAFPRGNTVEPLSRILEPVSVRHLDVDSPISSPRARQGQDTVPRRQMPSQLVRLGSIDKDPGVIGPLVWDLHCQRIKDASKPSTPKSQEPGRMRQRFNELMDDAFTLFGSAGSTPSNDTYTVEREDKGNEAMAQARNDNVRLPASPAHRDTVRGRSAGVGRDSNMSDCPRPRTALPAPRPAQRRAAWGPQATNPRHPSTPVVHPALITTEGKLAPDDPALPLISAIKSEIQRVRENAMKPN
ncbi:uncharacterized protein LOC123701297 [Colias croceus]|uniref:uncharacterized protein LOC123701297 n=1 Tax=Colias crocea TaxID=72248 RepID=UPI001E27DD98|nr:uncharacterized protein LOC123701297 [Colias croceus]